MKWIIERLKEPSTWRGLVLLISACGITLTEDQSEAIITAGLATIGAIDVFFEKK